MQQKSDLEVKAFFETLSNTASIKAKKQLLAEKRDDRNVKKFLDYLLNPFFVTGISEKKIGRPVMKEPTISFSSFHDLMPYIRENHTGTDEVLANVQTFLVGVDDIALRLFYIGIITKSIRIGCDVKTVNEGLGFDLIPQWEVQQAWDKHANFLQAQARAQKEIRGLIKQYDELLHKRWDLATDEQKARIEQIKANTDRLRKDSFEDEEDGVVNDTEEKETGTDIEDHHSEVSGDI